MRTGVVRVVADGTSGQKSLRRRCYARFICRRCRMYARRNNNNCTGVMYRIIYTSSRVSESSNETISRKNYKSDFLSIVCYLLLLLLFFSDRSACDTPHNEDETRFITLCRLTQRNVMQLIRRQRVCPLQLLRTVGDNQSVVIIINGFVYRRLNARVLSHDFVRISSA